MRADERGGWLAVGVEAVDAKLVLDEDATGRVQLAGVEQRLYHLRYMRAWKRMETEDMCVPDGSGREANRGRWRCNPGSRRKAGWQAGWAVGERVVFEGRQAGWQRERKRTRGTASRQQRHTIRDTQMAAATRALVWSGLVWSGPPIQCNAMPFLVWLDCGNADRTGQDRTGPASRALGIQAFAPVSGGGEGHDLSGSDAH